MSLYGGITAHEHKYTVDTTELYRSTALPPAESHSRPEVERSHLKEILLLSRRHSTHPDLLDAKSVHLLRRRRERVTREGHEVRTHPGF